MIDMTTVEPVDGKRPILAPQVVHAMKQTLQNDGQIIVLYNRRGYATMVQCTSCGGTWGAQIVASP